MNGLCPHRNLTLSQWRLEVFAQLFLPAEARCSRHQRGRSCQERCCSTQLTSLRPPHRATRRTRPPNTTITQSRCDSSTSSRQERLPRRPPPKKWDPYSSSGLSSLESLKSSLQKLSSKEASAIPPARDYKNVALPMSPILAKTFRKRQQPKPRPMSNEERMLETDPWAMLLAGPVRECKATKARMPRGLMGGWGLVTKDEDDTEEGKKRDVWLVPERLADFQRLENMGRRASEQNEPDKMKDEARNARRNDPEWIMGENEDAVNTAQYNQTSNEAVDNPNSQNAMHGRPETTTTTLQSSQSTPTTLPQMTTAGGDEHELDFEKDSFLDEGSEKEIDPVEDPFLHSASMSLANIDHGNSPAIHILPSSALLHSLTKDYTYLEKGVRILRRSSPVHRLIPLAWKNKIENAQHYRRGREQVNTALGMTQDTDVPVDLSKVKWQVDIEDRLLDILQRRVVICLRRVVEIEVKAGKHKKNSRRIQAKSLAKLLENERAAQEAQSRDTSAHTPTKSTTFLVPRILLYFGAVQPLRDVLATPGVGRDGDFLPLHLPAPHAAAPQTPIFPLKAMMGHRFEELLDVAKLPPADEADGLLVKANADYGDVLFGELWRLWRYVGGKQCMDDSAATVQYQEGVITKEAETEVVKQDELARDDKEAGTG